MRNIPLLLLLAALAVPAVADETKPFKAVDFEKLDRKIAKQPTYIGQQRYALFVFGPQGEATVWGVLDKSKKSLDYYDILYLDKNANGDLTEKGERFVGKYTDRGGRRNCVIRIGNLKVPDTKIVHTNLMLYSIMKSDMPGVWFSMKFRGGEKVSGGYGPANRGNTVWATTPEKAPVLRPTTLGPLSFAIYTWGGAGLTLARGSSKKVYLMAGNAGSGPDTLMSVTENFLKVKKPIGFAKQDKLVATLICKTADGKEVRTVNEINDHC